ncbi:MAG: hypothetical protein CL927_07795 [Deltaproteobacteria bacterium]|nr:hypothetical protein [Deltaproteobacteria bacterium]HCH62107.1 hypothetical protein [Deltaproteobacteria bacterium]
MALISSRRRFLAGLAAGAAAAPLPSFAWASGNGPHRFVLVLLRGGLDALAAVPPIDDPHYRDARGTLALAPKAVLPLDNTFGLHPALAPLANWYAEGHLMPVHAVGLSYRGRSHFNAQDALENGTESPSGADSGWLNRALVSMPGEPSATAIGTTLPLVLRGDATASSVDPTRKSRPPEDFVESVLDLYARDPILSDALTQALETRGQVMSSGSATRKRASRTERSSAGFKAAGTLMADANGPRIMVVDSAGWDTHARQGTEEGALARLLAGLASGLVELRAGLGDVWASTTVLCISEFGRTVRPNGTGGTDHGTGGVALLAGGNVLGGRVVTDWPGLRPQDLLDGRDLRPTLAARQLFKAALHGGLDISDNALEQVVFPGTAALPRPTGWFRS